MNNIPTQAPLKNTYVLMRHGRSIANDEGIIISDPKKGISGYGLSTTGKEEALNASKDAKEMNTLDSGVIIFSSDFARTRETAEIVANTLEAAAPTLTPKLRERFFGEWDGKENSNYEKIWSNDEQDSNHTASGVESVSDVLDRATELIEELERTYTGKTILLVSHGDTLQILQTAFANTEPSAHREINHLHTAEIRTL